MIGAFGHRSVFGAAALLAVVAALCVRFLVPESPVRRAARIDVRGALLLGGGLGAVLAYVSLGRDAGWLSAGQLALLAAGGAALACWGFLAPRTAEPVVDVRSLGRPVLLTLAALVLAAGSFRSMLQLTGIVAQIPAELGLGYGLGHGESVAVLLAAPNLGIAVGGICAGRLAGRRGPALPLLAGIGIGAAATLGMLAGVSTLPLAVGCGALIGVAAGAIGASGYNLATAVTPPQRQGSVAGLVSVVLALGSVVFSFAGAEILKATAVPVADGPPVSSAAGVYVHVGLAAGVFALAALPAAILVRGGRR